jgi:hypothetical protein
MDSGIGFGTKNHDEKYASVKKRLFAKFVDILIVLFLGLVWRGGPGSLLGFFYSLVADALPFKNYVGQSFGKKLLKIKVISGSSEPPEKTSYKMHALKTSVIRNAPVGLVTFFMIIPFWGWLLSIMIGIPLGLIELSLIARAQRRQRLGDVMAESVVLDLSKLPVHSPERLMVHPSTEEHLHEPKVL